MIKIWLLIWFLIPPGGGDNILQVQKFDSQEACKMVGDLLAEQSQAAQDAKRIVTYGGTCFPVPDSNNGST